MIDTVTQYLTPLWHWMLIAVVILFLIRFIIDHWASVSLWITDTIVYGLARKSRRLAKKPQELVQGWLSSEVAVCDDYARHQRAFMRSVEQYDQAQSYLRNADEKDREPMPLWVWVVLFIIVLLEAFGFSYVFSGKALPGASENLQVYQGLAIAFFIALAMLAMTHVTGQTAYLNSKIRKIRSLFNSDRADNKPNLQPTKQASIQSEDEDRDYPNYVRMLNRLVGIPPNVTQRHLMYVLLPLAVAAVMVLSYFVRSYVYDELRVAETTGQRIYFDSGKERLPKAVTGPNDDARRKAMDDAHRSDEIASKLTFVFLSIVFALIQGVAVWLSSHWGFAGVESRKAFQITKEFTTRKELERYMDEKRTLVSRLAQSQLSRLRQSLMDVKYREGVDSRFDHVLENSESRTFVRYLTMIEASAAVPLPVSNSQRASPGSQLFYYVTAQGEPSPQPLSMKELEEMARRGEITDTTPVVRQDGTSADWVRFQAIRTRRTGGAPELPPELRNQSSDVHR